MSAECTRCGSDIYYLSECPVCMRDRELELARDVINAAREFCVKSGKPRKTFVYEDIYVERLDDALRAYDQRTGDTA